MKNLKIKFIPYEKFKKENVVDVMNELQKNTIILIDAKLKTEEETAVIKEALKRVTTTFTGIELGSIELSKKKSTTQFDRIKNGIIEAIIGKKRGVTIIGPAKIVHKIKQDPEDLLLYV
jgi:hypothetical protein